MVETPAFVRPPLVETSLSMQFATLAKLQNVYMGMLWSGIRERYPNVLEQQALPPSFETFGGMPPQMGVPFLFPGAGSRFWFISSDDHNVFQLQQDRLVHNWRARGNPYPGYFNVREALKEDVRALSSFLEQEDLGLIQPNQCEVMYNSNIVAPIGADTHKSLGSISPLWSKADFSVGKASLEGSVVQLRMLLRDDDDQPIGRVHVSFIPQFVATDLSQVFALEIVVRGRPKEPTTSSAFDFLDIAHDVAFETFMAVTTSEMHEAWEVARGE